MSQKMTLELLVAMGVALEGGTTRIGPLPEARCSECRYDDMPHECGHCYMFMDPPEDNRCGAFEMKQFKVEWR